MSGLRRTAAAWILLASLALAVCAPAALSATAHSVSVDITPRHVANLFSPSRALGAGVDAQNYGAVDEIYVPGTINRLLGGGWGPVSYRLYTELSVQHWHWN